MTVLSIVQVLSKNKATKTIRVMLHNKQKPLRAIAVDVFAYPI